MSEKLIIPQDHHIHLKGAIPPHHFHRIQSEVGGEVTPEETEARFYWGEIPIWDELNACFVTPERFSKSFEVVLAGLYANGADRANIICNIESYEKRGLDVEQAFERVGEVIEDYEINHGFITLVRLGVHRKDGSEAIDRMVHHYKKLSERFDFVEAIDLNGDERRFPTKLYAETVARHKADGVEFTLHAGEGLDLVESLADAIDLEPLRIGHGTAAISDPRLITKLAERDIPLEVCPSSNEVILGIPQKDHPIYRYIDSGVKVVLGSDDPPFFDTDIAAEYGHVKKNGGNEYLHYIDDCTKDI